METQLQEMGVSTIGELATVPADLMEAVFGINGVALSRRARGIDSEMMGIVDTGSKSISRELTLEEDTVNEEYLACDAASCWLNAHAMNFGKRIARRELLL